MSEREIVIRIKFPERPRVRWLVGIGALVMVAAVVAYASVPNTFNPGDSLSSSKMNANFASLDSRVTTLEMGTTVLAPPGTIVAYGGTTPPNGWLMCDGSSVTEANYPNLYAAIGSAYGQPSSASFNVPDLRGRFLRGVDGGAGRDPDASTRTISATGGNAGDEIGSLQADAFASHSHGVNDPGHVHAPSIGGNPPSFVADDPTTSQYCLGSGGPKCFADTTLTTSSTTGITVQASGGSETRPQNVYVNYIIKY